MKAKGTSGVQFSITISLLVAILLTMLLLLFTTGPSHLLDSGFEFIARQCPRFSPGLPNNGSSIVASVATETFKEDVHAGKPPDWLQLPPIFNYTQKYLQLIAQNGSKPCHNIATKKVQLFGLPDFKIGDTYVKFNCGEIHTLILVAFDELDQKRCAGGDYFETEISGLNWKSRAPVFDLEDGSYKILLQMHPSFAGVYRFRVVLGFSNFHSLHRRPEQWFRNETVIDMHIEFVNEEHGSSGVIGLPRLNQCTKEDFQLDSWLGRWVRFGHNSHCSVDKRGRFKCLDPKAKCNDPWCQGPIAALESNGWVYSAHCAFRIFTQDDAWRCLNKKWIFFWGDSNHVDTVRNFLNFVLGFENIPEVPRRFDANYSRPKHPSQYVRITSMFNGHSNVSRNHEGLYSLHDDAYREQIAEFFREKTAPDAIIMNSGLHDGVYWKHLYQFAEGADKAVEFWTSLLNGLQSSKPRVVYRTTITTAGWARAASFNPQKMEIFNSMLVEKFKKANLLWGVVDGFDLTYPWHFDHNCSDGVHYGKPPAAVQWYGQLGHQYFVDLMLAHILMHALCVS